MLQSDIVAGGVYRLRWHDGSFTEVEIIREKGYPMKRYIPGRGYETIGRKVRYTARNLKTGRIVEIKSAAKLRERVR